MAVMACRDVTRVPKRTRFIGGVVALAAVLFGGQSIMAQANQPSGEAAPPTARVRVRAARAGRRADGDRRRCRMGGGESSPSSAAPCAGRSSTPRSYRAAPIGNSSNPTASPSSTRATRSRPSKASASTCRTPASATRRPTSCRSSWPGEIVDPKLVYFRTVPKFETAVPELQWLARSVFVGIGERFPTEVVVRFYRLE